MTQADKDMKSEHKIAVVEIIVDGKVVYSKAVFIYGDGDIETMKTDMDVELYYYDEAK